MGQTTDTSEKSHTTEKAAGSRRRRFRRRVIFAVAALVLGAVAGCLLVEVTMRVFGIKPERYEFQRRAVLINGKYYSFKSLWAKGRIKRQSQFSDQGLGMGEYVPGVRFKIIYDSNPRGYFDDDNGVPVQINSLGLRGPEISEEKPEDTIRILGLGDSFTFGTGVRDEDTFLRRLEGLLNKTHPDDLKFQVLNAGTAGYNTRDEVIYLEHRWLKLDPDVVLFNFYLNDAYFDSAFLNMGDGLGIYLKPEGIAKYSRLYDYVQHGYRSREALKDLNQYYSQDSFKNPKTFLENPKPESEAWRQWFECRDALKRAVELSKEHEMPIALVIFPEFYNLNDYPFTAIHNMVSETCRQLEIPCLDLIKVFRGMDEQKLWVHRSDHHPNEIAHKMAADAICTFLQQSVFHAGDVDKPKR